MSNDTIDTDNGPVGILSGTKSTKIWPTGWLTVWLPLSTRTEWVSPHPVTPNRSAKLELPRIPVGTYNLRFDDTNPAKEDQEFIDAIQADVKWLDVGWDGEVRYASDNFEQLYDWAEYLIGKGRTYVDDLSAGEMRDYRGTLTEPGKNSPYRDPKVDENLDLFRRMRAGEFEDGARVLRAKIDMAAGNINLRDPVLYRIVRAPHPRTGDAWCIYPTYDFAHGQTDAIEGITHSLCTLEFEDHRPLYDWLIESLPVPAQPRQYEFSRLNMTHTILSNVC